MKKVTIITLAIICMTGIASAQFITGTPHDLSSSTANAAAASDIDRICVFCHTPHQNAAANGQYPLWNHTVSVTAAFGVYSSVTMNATPTNIGSAGGPGSLSVSMLCMACHDGTIAVESLYNETNGLVSPNVTGTAIDGSGFLQGNALVGTDLTNDHPVNFTYDAALVTADGGLNAPPTSLLVGGTVQCSSCHDPHNNQFGSFLTTNNSASNLCLICHAK